MGYNGEKRIQISRSKYIEESRAIAALRLVDKHFLAGEVMMLNYYKDPDIRTDVGTLVVIGVKEGVGEDCYRILEMGGQVPVRKVGELPDYSKLVHGEIYVWYGDPDLRDDVDEEYWCYVYEEDGHRVIERITDGPFIFLDLDSGYRWFYKDQVCKREDDFFTTEQMEILLQSLSSTKPTIKVSSLSGNLFLVGDVKDITVQVKVEDQAGNDITKECLFFVHDKEIFLDSKNQYVFRSINQDKILEIEARQSISPNVYVSVVGTVDLKFGYYFYYGQIPEDWTPGDSEIAALSNRTLHYQANFNWEGINLKDQKIAFAYPKRYGYLSHIYDTHRMDFINTYDVYDEGYEIDGVRYIVYIKKDVVDIIDFKQIYVFTDPENLDYERSTLLELLTAWKVRNTASGLVTLNEDGKIPEELYNINAASVFIPIEEIYDDYPEEGLERGKIYYIRSTGKLFTAISATTGSISDVVPGFVYTYNNDFYSWTGQSLRPFGRLTTKDINDITEIL